MCFSDISASMSLVKFTPQSQRMILEDLKKIETRARISEQEVVDLKAVISSTKTELEALENENTALKEDLKTVLEHRTTLDTMKNLVAVAVKNIGHMKKDRN